MTLALTVIILSIIPPLFLTTSRATTTSRGIAKGIGQARIALGNLEAEVGSASEICLPTTLTTNTADPTVAPGFAVRVLSDAFGTEQWVQWAVFTPAGQSAPVLEEQEWPTSWVTGDAEPSFVPVALPIVNTSSQAPFALSTAGTGSPQTLSVDLYVGTAIRGIPNQPVQVAAGIAALDTPYGPQNPPLSPPQPCATTED